MNLKPALSTEAQVDHLMAFIWSFLFTCYRSDLKNNNNNKRLFQWCLFIRESWDKQSVGIN